MSEAWTSQPQAARVLALATDLRPAWLWSGDGTRLVWHNHAATLFGARLKNGTLRRCDKPVPVKGQISRILRLGILGYPMLSRMQFIAGRKPLSATCACTPLALGEDQPMLLVVGSDPITADILAHDPVPQNGTSTTEDTPQAQGETQSLGELVDRLARDERLFAPLGEEEEDEAPDAPLPDVTGTGDASDDLAPPIRDSDWDHDDPLASEEQAFTDDSAADSTSGRTGLWQLTGRGLTTVAAGQPEPPAPEPDTEALEQVSRYNFEELARILNDKIGQNGESDIGEAEPAPSSPAPASNLVSLSDETLVLNRLPLGILIFRDQDILFANRALVELTGYGNAATLRTVGLPAVIPTTEGGEPAGPVNQLVRRDGSHVTVSARLNTISWQGRSAMMLSARAIDGDAGREDEIRRFAADLAALGGTGYIEADRIGLVTTVSGNRDILPAGAEKGARISDFVAHGEQQALARFLALPARFSETARPAVALKGRVPGMVLKLFALGRAGIVSGYALLVERQAHPAETTGSVSAVLLARIGRELRRPLNTIVGFSELIASESFGPLSNTRYLEYARDINAAGTVITDLADEIDDYARIAEGKLELTPDNVDLSALLADCLVRVRGQAGIERVLLRSAISERLPLVRVDAATLRQAVLNMLASAITDAGEGNKVVLSAQPEDDGAVNIHVRDAARAPGILADQFVVFRDGLARDGTARQPVRSSIGLTLTRTLVAVNACTLALDPASETGTLMTLTIPATLVVR